MLFTRKQLQARIKNILNESLPLKLTKNVLGQATFYKAPHFFINTDDPTGNALSSWMSEMINLGQTRDKGAEFEEFAYLTVLPNIPGTGGTRNFVNLNDTLKVADAPAADVGRLVDKNNRRVPYRTENISVKISSNKGGNFETTQTATANLAAMLYDVHFTGETKAETPLKKLSERIKADSNSMSIIFKNVPCKYIELPLGLLSFKFNGSNITKALHPLTEIIDMELPIFTEKTLRADIKNKPPSMSTREEDIKTAVVSHLGILGNSLDERVKNAIKLLNHIALRYAYNFVTNLNPNFNPSYDKRISNAFRDSTRLDRHFKSIDFNHISALTNKNRIDLLRAISALFSSKFKQITYNNARGRKIPVPGQKFYDKIKKVTIPMRTLKRGVTRQQIENALSNIEAPHMKIYYGNPAKNRFKIITPEDTNNFSIYVKNPDAAAKQTEAQAADAAGNKVSAKRTFLTNNNHFNSVQHVGNFYFGKDKFDQPKLDLKVMFDAEFVDAYNQMSQKGAFTGGIDSPLVDAAQKSAESRQLIGEIFVLASLAKKNIGKSFVTSYNSLKRKTKALQRIRERKKIEQPGAFFAIDNAIGVFNDIDSYLKVAKVNLTDVEPFIEGMLAASQCQTLEDITENYNNALTNIAAYVELIIEDPIRNRNHLEIVGTLIDSLTKEEKKKIAEQVYSSELPDIYGNLVPISENISIGNVLRPNDSGKINVFEYSPINNLLKDVTNILDFTRVDQLNKIIDILKDNEMGLEDASITNLNNQSSEISKGSVALKEYKLYASIIQEILKYSN